MFSFWVSLWFFHVLFFIGKAGAFGKREKIPMLLFALWRIFIDKKGAAVVFLGPAAIRAYGSVCHSFLSKDEKNRFLKDTTIFPFP